MARRAKSEAQRAADAAIGRRIERARRAKGMTQAALAERVGVTQQMVYWYESGTCGFPVSLLEKLCRALDVSPRQLLGLTSTTKDSLASRSAAAKV